MLKKINISDYKRIPMHKLDLSEYKKQLGFTFAPGFKFRVSKWHSRKQLYTRQGYYTLEKAKEDFKYKTVLCVLYDKDANEANIVLEGQIEKR